MTPSTIYEIALDRVGLTASAATFKNRARQYLNLAGQDLYSWSVQTPGGTAPVRWQWLMKQTTLSTSNGTRTYSLASDVLEPLSFRDQTSDRTLPIESSLAMDWLDPDEDETGDPELVVLVGLNSSTGYWEVDIHPTPDATNTLDYRYYARWVDLTSNDDDTDLAAKVPTWVQPAFIHAVAEMYYDEKGDNGNGAKERALKQAIVGQAVARNIAGQSTQRTRLRRKDFDRRGFDVRVQTGTLS